ncbi:MAG: translation elongation factor Ts [Desulfitobacteriaceae bacterium]
MAEITAALVKELRERTGAGMMDCKKALAQTDGDMDKAIDFLREKGLAAAAKKEGRVAAEGLVEAYIHGGGRIGVLVEINCETDFVARGEEFKLFVKDIALQIAAANPQYLVKEEVPAEMLQHERDILRAQALNEGKPEKIVEKMVEGRIEKFYKEVCLMEQSFIKDPDVVIKDLVLEKTSKIGERIVIRRFTRYELGAGIEKRQDDFAAEVMKEINR